MIKWKVVFCANSHFYYCVLNFSLHTKIVSWRTKDFAVSCGALNENRFNFEAMWVFLHARAFVCLSYIFPTISDDECQLTLYLSRWAGTRVCKREQNNPLKLAEENVSFVCSFGYVCVYVRRM